MKKGVKKKAKIEVKIQIALVLLTVIFITLVYYFVPPTFIGYTVLQGSKIDISNASNFNYNDSEVEIVNGIISLKQITTTNNYTEEKKITVYAESAIRYTNDGTVNVTEEISALDGEITNIDKNKIFDVAFNETLENNDTLNFYLKGINDGSETEIYLCQVSAQCSSPGYGKLDYNGSEGWFSITIENLPSPVQSFNIDPPVKVKFDYINATKIILEEHSETNISYPHSSAITTEIALQNLVSWDSLEAEEILNDQNISYEYSADSGLTWELIGDSKNLTNVSVSTQKIMIRIILYSNGTAAPSISSLNITYLTKEPITYYEINNSGVISTIRDENITVNSSSSKLELNIVATESLSNIQFNISEPGDATPPPTTLSRVKELEIISQELQDKISTATIKVYYTDEEVNNLNESTLKLYYYNETSQEWQALESAVNTEENYIQANLQHFSVYGIFGEEIPQQEASSSGSSGGSGGKSEFTRGAQPQPQQQESATEIKAEETTQEQTIETEAETPTLEQEQTTPTGNIVRIKDVLTTGKVNRSLIILAAILIVAYIIAKIEESGKGNFLSLK